MLFSGFFNALFRFFNVVFRCFRFFFCFFFFGCRSGFNDVAYLVHIFSSTSVSASHAMEEILHPSDECSWEKLSVPAWIWGNGSTYLSYGMMHQPAGNPEMDMITSLIPPKKLVTHDTWSIAVIEWFTKTGFLVEIWEGSPFFLWSKNHMFEECAWLCLHPSSCTEVLV